MELRQTGEKVMYSGFALDAGRDRGSAAADTLTGIFARSVDLFSDLPAVSDDDRSLTYRELDQASTAMAGWLAALGVGLEDRVGVYMDRQVNVVVAILGILKAGAAYLAVDPRYPDSRRDHMLTAGDVKVVVVQPDWAGRLSHVDCEVVTFGGSADSGPAPALAIGREHAASILFTSGSTGEAKGIVLEHGNIASFAENRSLPSLRPGDRVGQISSLSFDAFHFELWAALAAGAEVVVLPPVPKLLAADFRRELTRRRISAMLVPTMVFNHVVREDRDAFAALRVLHVGGDVLVPQAAGALLGGDFRGALFNLYGPAEATTACTAHRVTLADTEGGSVPIGRPLDGVTIQLRTPDGELVGADGVGELHIGGPGVARGYLNRPDLTGERFVAGPDPAGPPRFYRTGDLARRRPDGVLEFLGRADDQVKIQGFRVEPAEVERTLRRCAQVRDAVVLVDVKATEHRLVAFIELAGGASLAEVRRHAEAELPHFMRPHAFVVVSEVPATEHGKRDTEALLAMLAQDSDRRSDRQAPTGETERWLAEVWEELLAVEDVGRDEDFFDLGGHSVLAFRTRQRILRQYGVELDFGVVLEQTVLRDLAAAIDEAVREKGA
jgi:amino acid adenylation domain-containing protein